MFFVKAHLIERVSFITFAKASKRFPFLFLCPTGFHRQLLCSKICRHLYISEKATSRISAKVFVDKGKRKHHHLGADCLFQKLRINRKHETKNSNKASIVFLRLLRFLDCTCEKTGQISSRIGVWFCSLFGFSRELLKFLYWCHSCLFCITQWQFSKSPVSRCTIGFFGGGGHAEAPDAHNKARCELTSNQLRKKNCIEIQKRDQHIPSVVVNPANLLLGCHAVPAWNSCWLGDGAIRIWGTEDAASWHLMQRTCRHLG